MRLIANNISNSWALIFSVLYIAHKHFINKYAKSAVTFIHFKIYKVDTWTLASFVKIQKQTNKFFNAVLSTCFLGNGNL